MKKQILLRVLTFVLFLSSSIKVVPPAVGETPPSSPNLKNGEVAEAERLHQEFLKFYNQGNYEEAIPLVKKVLSIREKFLGEDHPFVADSLNNLALLYTKLGKYVQAEPLFQRSLEDV